jgi:outer membrane protein TolC
VGVASNPPARIPAAITIDGKTYQVELVEDSPKKDDRTPNKGSTPQAPKRVWLASNELPELPPLAPPSSEDANQRPARIAAALEASPAQEEVLQLNLPTALSMVGGDHPAVGLAQWRVQEAYARFDQARVLWLPSIQPGLSFHRHDGNYQASNGAIVDVNRGSYQYGLGAGATGAGTTPRAGLQAQFHLADAIFQPRIAEKTAWARGHAAACVINTQLRDVAIGYLQLLRAEQNLRIVEEARQHTAAVAKLTSDYAAAGQGLQADADRLKTELNLVEDRLAAAHERAEVASANLAQLLSIDATERIVPLDPTVVSLTLVPQEHDKATLISTGLSNRPELQESQALVAAAQDQFNRQKSAPFVPSVLLGFSTGGFGGGNGGTLDKINDRYDFDAVVTWQIRNFGLGERAARRESEAQVHQAEFAQIRVMDQVAREVSTAYAQVTRRAERIAITQKAIPTAQHSYERNLSRIRDGKGLPLEVLQSVQALENAQRAYLDAVIDHNQAQFQLQWAVGWSVSSGE